MALMHLTIIPLGTDSPSLGPYVADILRILQQEGLAFKLTDMGTIVEGDTAKLLSLAARLHEEPFTHGVKRVCTQISIDDRRDKKVAIGDKINSVQALL
ncbi:MAG: MTH1187 family thiamine-binding protein [Proteobacteria bacterium]|nr:MTH1187 family thiamine-binding protein [Pseudomonadota bacterium]MBU1708768.1 MTH1187 family thiamine-binding protein [Pseudomonadota bacterium]